MTASDAMSSTPRRPVFARVWPRVAAQLDARGGVAHRRQLLAGLAGRVIEVGAGDGRNFAHYPSTVSDVIAVEPEPHLRERARAAADRAPVPVTVVDGVAEALPASDDAVDAGVVAVVLCSVADQAAALGEIARVLRPGGRLRFFEHVAADGRAHRRVQQVLDATLWPRLFGGCHTARDTVTAIADAGFHVDDVARFRFPDSPLPTPTSPHVLGEAHVG